jgi:hypothetical protein
VQIETVSLLEVIAAARARQASLVPESAGYVVLALGRAMAGVPMSLDLEQILLTTEGAVSLEGPRKAVSPGLAVANLRKLMVELLDLSNGSSSVLRTLAERNAPEPSLESFFASVAKALIPINRAAAKRALARLARETVKAFEAGTLERPSIALDGGRGSVLSRASRPSRVSRASEAPAPKAPPARKDPAAPSTVAAPQRDSAERNSDSDTSSSVLAEHTTPSPGEHAASLTPTFVDSDVSEQHERMSFREEIMRAVVGYVGKDAVTSDAPTDTSASGASSAVAPAELAGRPSSLAPSTPSLAEPMPAEKGGPGCVALDLLDKVRAAGERGLETGDSTKEDSTMEKRRRFSGRPEKIVARFEDVAAFSPTTVESLLERFERGDDSKNTSLQLVERSLGQLGGMHMTPLSGPVGVEDASPDPSSSEAHSGGRVAFTGEAPVPTPSIAVEVDLGRESVPSRTSATPAGQAVDRGVSSLPPFMSRLPARPRKGAVGLGVAAVAALSVAAVAFLRPELVGRAPRAAVAPGLCRADLTLKNLPESHEVLLRLGTAPLTTRALPRGVRLELVATAPDHEPGRFLIERDADWRESAGGLDLHAKLEPGALRAWPGAPVGDVGGVGPAGQLNVDASPAGAEIWLVLAAGGGDRAWVTVPCEDTAHVLVVDPNEPARAKRVFLEPELLRAAAKSGAGEVAVQP